MHHFFAMQVAFSSPMLPMLTNQKTSENFERSGHPAELSRIT